MCGGRRSWIRQFKHYVTTLASKSKATAKGGLLSFMSAATELHPPASMTLPIYCEHSELDPNKRTRKVVRREVWDLLRGKFPDGPALSALTSPCTKCAAEGQKKKENVAEDRNRRNQELKSVEPLFRRRATGYPVTSTDHDSVGKGPLDVGTYVLLPRKWMTAWRSYLETDLGVPPEEDGLYQSLYCRHNLCVLPSHVLAFVGPMVGRCLPEDAPKKSASVELVHLTDSDGDGDGCVAPVGGSQLAAAAPPADVVDVDAGTDEMITAPSVPDSNVSSNILLNAPQAAEGAMEMEVRRPSLRVACGGCAGWVSLVGWVLDVAFPQVLHEVEYDILKAAHRGIVANPIRLTVAAREYGQMERRCLPDLCIQCMKLQFRGEVR